MNDTVFDRAAVKPGATKPRSFSLPSRKAIFDVTRFAVPAIAVAAALIWYLTPPVYDVVHPVRGEAVEAVYATGTVEPTAMTPISARIGARLVSLEVDEGATIKKGQVLAQLERDDLRGALQQLEAQESFALADYRRYAALVRDGLIARQTYERSKSIWQAAHAAVEQARAQVGYMTLVAPADGVVIRRDGEIGQMLPVNQPLFWISTSAPLRVTADVDEEDIHRVRVGQEVLIRADALPGKIIDGHVTEITPKGDPVARTYRVRVSLPQKSGLMIGMTAETNIVTYRKANAVLVPAGSVVGGNAVWTIHDGKLARVSVLVGAKGTTAAEVRDGLGTEVEIVRTPANDFHDNKKLRARSAAWAP